MPEDHELADSRTHMYAVLVDYFIQIEKLSRDEAHTKVDAIFKFFEAVGE